MRALFVGIVLFAAFQARASDMSVYETRAADWRIGPVVYHVFVDRFAPPADLDAKRAFFAPPRVLRSWSDLPKRGHHLADAGLWSHELEFWGGDLASLRSKLDYIKGLQADVLYLNPIHKAYTNHKYDAQDYFDVSPEYGTRADVVALAADAHQHGMKLMLDGVFNHMGRTAPIFQEALRDPAGPHRDWFIFGPQYKFGYRAWYNVGNLPELNLENPRVRARIWGDADSVVQGYLRDGVDGWRLDVAFDIGFEYLTELTQSAHSARPGSLVVGEIWNYPAEWFPAIDGIMNFFARQIILELVAGHIAGGQAGVLLERMVADAGIEPILNSWIILDNHDTPRLKTIMPDQRDRHLAELLQFTLPGAPVVYYGHELGMEGGDDPFMRAPMRWDLAVDDNPDFAWMRKLLNMRRELRALRIGDFKLLDTRTLLAFQRSTDKVADTVIVIVNATDSPVEEVIALRDSKIMNFASLKDELSDASCAAPSGMIRIRVPARTGHVFRVDMKMDGDYSPYKRVP